MPSIAKNTSVEIEVSIVEIESVGLRAGGIFLKSSLMFSTWLGDGNDNCEGGGNDSEGDDDEGDNGEGDDGESDDSEGDDDEGDDGEGDDDDSEGDGDDVDGDSESDDGDGDGDGEGDCVGDDDGAVLAIAVVTNTDDDAPLGRPG